MFRKITLASLMILASAASACAADDPLFTRKEDVIYGRKHGLAMTMDVFIPKKDANGAAVVWAVSGGWFSAKEHINAGFVLEFISRGYTVFAVVHGSQPKFTILEAVEDMNRAVRYIRHHAKDYNIDPDRIGVSGGSAGGHLSLMMGTAGAAGDPKATDAVNRESSRVQAVACFFPPTDFLNYGKEGEMNLGYRNLAAFRAPFDWHVWDPKVNQFERVIDPKELESFARRISPVNHVTADSAPTLIIHGDKDLLVPIQQAEVMIKKLKESKVTCELIVREGQAHGWAGIDKDLKLLADWFDTHLKKR